MKGFYQKFVKVGCLTIIFLFLISYFWFLVSDKVLATESPQINLEYPWGTSESQTPAGFINEFYKIALGVVGAAAFGVIIYGAILYTVSAGNTSRQQDAKDWITGAVWGVALLLCAYLILWTINPNLVILKNPAMEPIEIPPPGENLAKAVDCSKISPSQCESYSECQLAMTSQGNICEQKSGIFTEEPCETYGTNDCPCPRAGAREACESYQGCKWTVGIYGVSYCGGTGTGAITYGAEDQEIRNYLSQPEIGITVNKKNCSLVCIRDCNCTSLDNLPLVAIEGLTELAEVTGPFEITGGTENYIDSATGEPVHATHGPGKPVVDISFQPDNVTKYVEEYGKRPAVPTTSKGYPVYEIEHIGGSNRTAGFVKEPDHWHVVFN